ncbi:MAG: hypothetical protein ACO1OB_00505 [Archangium sp.]
MWRLLWVGVLFVSCAPQSETRLFAVDFGTVKVGELHTTLMRVENRGTTPAKLLRVEQRGGISGFTIEPNVEPLPGGAEANWTVRFEPMQTGEFVARFAAVFEDGESVVTLRAFAGQPCVSPAPIDFGPGPKGARTLSFGFRNDGVAPARFFFGELTPPFSSGTTGNVVLPAGTTGSIELRFAGDTPGIHETRWLIQNDPGCTPAEVLVTASVEQPVVVTVPGRLHFGEDAARLNLEVHNSGDEAVEVTPLFGGTGFKLADERKFTIAPKSLVTLTVLRDDLTTAPLFGEMRLATNSYPREVVVPLLARTPTGCVTAMDSNVTLSPHEVGCTSATRFVTLKNECVHAVKLETPRIAPPFAVVSATLGELAAGATREIGIAARSNDAGVNTGALVLPVDLLDRTEDVVVALSGSSSPVTLRDERRVIPNEIPPLDVLLVIDDTPAMREVAASLGRNLSSLNTYLSANGARPRYAVTSTSMNPAEQGVLRPGWLTEPSNADLESYAAYRGVQTSPSSCLETIVAAFSPPLSAEFRRPGAALLVLCITANADQTSQPSSQLFARIREVTPRETQFGVFARFTAGATCGGTRDTGVLAAFTSFNDGARDELCTPDWAATLERIGKTASFGYRTIFHLAEFPDLTRAPIRTFIDTTEIPRTDPDPVLGSTLWSYLSSTNAVSFEPPYAPEPGREVRLTYAPMCSR